MPAFTMALHLYSISVLLTCILLINSMRLNYAAASSTCKTSESEIHIEEAEIYTPLQRVDHLSRFSLGLRLSNEHRWLKFTLEPNDNIIADNTQLSYVDNGNYIGVCRNMERSAVMAFKGSVWVQGTGKCWDKVGWARIYIRKDGPDALFEGTYSKQKTIYDIQIRPAEMNNTREPKPSILHTTDNRMVVDLDSRLYQHPNLAPQRSDISLSGHKTKTQHFGLYSAINISETDMYCPSFPAREAQYQLMSSGQEQYPDQWDLRRTISNTTGCPNSRMVASVGIATDCSYTASFDSTDAVIHNVIRMINSASEVFESSFNITLSLGALVVGERCQDLTSHPRTWNIPCSNGSLSHRLDLFSRWRASRRDNHAFWTLMTGCSGAGIGLAWMAQLCNTNFDQHRGTGANVVARTGVEWPVFAHEAGHILGAVHDCESYECQSAQATSLACCPYSEAMCDAGRRYIMTSTFTNQVDEFSPCSIGNICTALGHNVTRSDCLAEDVTVIVADDTGSLSVSPPRHLIGLTVGLSILIPCFIVSNLGVLDGW